MGKKRGLAVLRIVFPVVCVCVFVCVLVFLPFVDMILSATCACDNSW